MTNLDFRLHIIKGEGESAKLQLLNDITYKNTDTGKEWVIPKGFMTDGNSVPRPFTALFLHYDESTLAALVHDYACQEARTLKQRFESDKDFLANMAFDGVPWAIDRDWETEGSKGSRD